MRRTGTFVFASLCIAGAAEAGEFVGPWHITATPETAALVAGGGTSWGWINLVREPVSINDAFTGAGIVDDGFANASPGTTIEVTFAAGALVNRPGADLVMLDARFDLGAYSVATGLDGFAMSLDLPADAFAATGVTRLYYYERNNGGPFGAEVWAAGIDLSLLGVPDGAAVQAVRFTTTNGECDPVGIGVVPAPGVVGVVGMAALLVGRRRGARLR